MLTERLPSYKARARTAGVNPDSRRHNAARFLARSPGTRAERLYRLMRDELRRRAP